MRWRSVSCPHRFLMSIEKHDILLVMKIESDVLKRLGPVPFWRGTGKCLNELEKIYRKASTFARERLESEMMSPNKDRK
jgi:hypothetical protein